MGFTSGVLIIGLGGVKPSCDSSGRGCGCGSVSARKRMTAQGAQHRLDGTLTWHLLILCDKPEGGGSSPSLTLSNVTPSRRPLVVDVAVDLKLAHLYKQERGRKTDQTHSSFWKKGKYFTLKKHSSILYYSMAQGSPGRCVKLPERNHTGKTTRREKRSARAASAGWCYLHTVASR